MPRYFFHFVRGEARIPDPDGIDMSESDMASLRGAKIVSELLEAIPELFEGWEGWSLEIVDELGTVVQTLTLPDSSESPFGNSRMGGAA
jgi:hypothetical protein